MAHKWDVIGTQLNQTNLVNDFNRHPNYDTQSFCRQILHAAIESGCLPNYKTFLACLRSDVVDLAQAAVDLLKAVVYEAEREKQQESHVYM